MAKVYSASLMMSKAARVGDFIETILSFDRPVPNKTITFSGLDDLQKQMKDFADSYSHGCHVSARLANGIRKPAGFDSACHDYFYLDPPATP